MDINLCFVLKSKVLANNFSLMLEPSCCFIVAEMVQVNLIIRLSLGSMETDRVISETLLYRGYLQQTCSKIIFLGTKAW